LIVECLFVGAHSDVRIHEVPEDDPDDSGTSGLFDAPYVHKHTTSTNCSGSHGRASYSVLPSPSGGHGPS